jgi:transcriptional regulator with XRE-family HTH domain
VPDSSSGQDALARRLRELRGQWPGVVVTQRQLAQALRVSVSLVSSWESATTPALPSEDWLQAYALFFATQRSLEPDPHLLEQRELTDEEERTRRELVDELVELRDVALRPAGTRPRTGARGGTFYYFPDDLPVRIICGTLPEYELLREPPRTEDVLHAARHVQLALGEKAPDGLAEAVEELDHYGRVQEALRVVKAAAQQAYDDASPDQKDLGEDADGPVRYLGVLSDTLANIEDSGVQYANRWHPNAIASLWNADMDAAAELAQHVLGENPGADVHILLDTELTARDLTAGHVIVLGQADSILASVANRRARATSARMPAGTMNYLSDRLELPVYIEVPEGADPEYDAQFVVESDEEGVPDRGGVRHDTYAPRFVLQGGQRLFDQGQPRLEYDVALLARTTNPFNQGATLTVCTGIFSRGTYGTVRALTDPTLRSRNEQFLHERFGREGFWLLLHVPVLSTITGAQTLTPDLTRPFHRLRSHTL